jgi:hypothetical protein
MKSWTSALAALLVVLATAPSAWAAPPGICDQDGECSVEVVLPGDPGDEDPGQPSNPGKKPPIPQCSSFSGVVVQVGTQIEDLPEDLRPAAGAIRIVCMDGADRMWLWGAPRVNAESLARTLLARMQLQPVPIAWTPLRNDGMGIVGVPTWLWVDDPARLTWGPASISAGGVTLTARVESVSWSMGNGDVVRCSSSGTPWRRGMGAGPSPTCGYTYLRQGSYTVTATAHWVARWSGYGQSGVIPFELIQRRGIEIGEVQVVAVR